MVGVSERLDVQGLLKHCAFMRLQVKSLQSRVSSSLDSSVLNVDEVGTEVIRVKMA